MQNGNGMYNGHLNNTNYMNKGDYLDRHKAYNYNGKNTQYGNMNMMNMNPYNHNPMNNHNYPQN
jgi:hypothetical protein